MLKNNLDQQSGIDLSFEQPRMILLASSHANKIHNYWCPDSFHILRILSG